VKGKATTVGGDGRLLTRLDCDITLRKACPANVAETGSGVLAGSGPLVIAIRMRASVIHKLLQKC
jgi:hypothetical protein